MTQSNTMRETIIQHNSFIDTVIIVPIFGIIANHKEQMKEILSKSLHLTVMKPVRKSESEGKHLLVTNQCKLYYAQRETDNLLGKYN